MEMDNNRDVKANDMIALSKVSRNRN